MAARNKLPKMSPGQRYGRLTVIEFLWKDRGHYIWKFRCDCGSEVQKSANTVRQGNAKSCGCWRVEFGKIVGGKVTHGLTNTPTYRSWQKMRDRCFNVNGHAYELYGGRGITVCDRWKDSFENFLADMGHRPDGHSLDRVDAQNAGGPSKKSGERSAPKEQQVWASRNFSATEWKVQSPDSPQQSEASRWLF